MVDGAASHRPRPGPTRPREVEIEKSFKAVNSLENEADDLYDFSIVELFKEKDPIKIMMYRNGNALQISMKRWKIRSTRPPK